MTETLDSRWVKVLKRMDGPEYNDLFKASAAKAYEDAGAKFKKDEAA